MGVHPLYKIPDLPMGGWSPLAMHLGRCVYKWLLRVLPLPTATTDVVGLIGRGTEPLRLQPEPIENQGPSTPCWETELWCVSPQHCKLLLETGGVDYAENL